MDFKDNEALALARLAATAPQLTQAPSSVVRGLVNPFVVADGNTGYLIGASQADMSVGTASLPALLAKAADLGVAINRGTTATRPVIFSIPQALSGATTIPAQTTFSTPGNGLTTPAQAFTLLADTTIPAGSTTSPTGTIQATTPGSAANIAPGATLAFVTPIAGVSVAVQAGGTDGVDPDGVATLQQKIYAQTRAPGSLAAVTAAILAVSGVYDALVIDPQNGTGAVTYDWSDSTGATPGLSGTTITAGTLAAQVDAAVRQALAPGATPTPAAFTIVTLTSLTASYSAPATMASTVIEPLIKAQVAAYVQSLVHGLIPTVFGMSAALQTGINPQTNVPLAGGPVAGLSYFALSATTPAIGTAAQTTLYRLTGAPGSVVALTRV